MTKLNIGSHNKKLEGYINLDIQDLENVDVVHDITVAPWPFDEESVDEIKTDECLEHISFRKIDTVLAEAYRVLKTYGKIKIQVPDIEAMCRMVDLQCECVPRKTNDFTEYKADPNCFSCGGKALIHPERWQFAFVGAQKHEWDLHRNVFTFHYLLLKLEKAGFMEITKIPNIYKLIVEAVK